MCPDTSSLAKQQGAGLPLAIFVITVLSLLVSFMAQIQQGASEQLSLQIQSQRAFFAAESGAQAALNRLLPPDGSPGRSCATSPFHSVTLTAQGLAGCSVQVSCRLDLAESRNYYTLVSKGVCGSGLEQASRSIEVRAQ